MERFTSTPVCSLNVSTYLRMVGIKPRSSSIMGRNSVMNTRTFWKVVIAADFRESSSSFARFGSMSNKRAAISAWTIKLDNACAGPSCICLESRWRSVSWASITISSTCVPLPRCLLLGGWFPSLRNRSVFSNDVTYRCMDACSVCNFSSWPRMTNILCCVSRALA